MAESVNPSLPGTAPPGAGWQVLPEWIQRQVSHMRGERVYCRDGKVRTVNQVRQVNRTRELLWYVVTTMEDETRPKMARGGEYPEERGICEMGPDEPMAAHARFIECEPDYLRDYRDETVRMFLFEPGDQGDREVTTDSTPRLRAPRS
jgi:hypothetical protein